ncbi:MAG: histidine phosphatase family protein [Ruminococcus sp.]|nr:histidine phosphatase family protein [Ruminococcus sp.]
MVIYFTRHGQTTMNTLDHISGVTDCELTDEGRQQALLLAQECERAGDIDTIICSPLKRARDTAKAVADRLGLEIVTDPRLTEWDYGEYEDKHRTTEGFARAKREFGVKMKGGGESLLQLAHRVYSCIDDIREKYSDKTVLCVCHGGVCRAAHTYFEDMTTDEFMHFFMGNCELRRYEI